MTDNTPTETTDNMTPETTDEVTDDRPQREAARYRTRLRQAEETLAGTEAQLAATREAILDRELHPAYRSLLKLSGRDTGDLFDETGRLDEARLQEVALELDAEHPGIIDRQRGVWLEVGEKAPLQVLRKIGKGAAAPFGAGEGGQPFAPAGTTWAQAFAPRH